MSIAVIDVKPHEKFEGVYWVKFEDGSEKLATRNLAPGHRVYGEQLIRWEGVEYRIWNPYRSKLAAAILKGIKEVPIKRGYKVLYLGAASGTTASHVSDIVGPEGVVYCVEFAPRVMRELVERCCEVRKNMVPILADAQFPSLYRMIVDEVDAVYADIAQPFQSKILADNADVFLKDKGWIMIAIKAMSIDVTQKPSETYKREIDTLKDRGFDIVDVVHLEPFDEAHAFVVAKRA
ncbi:MAG: fibrillarin-like rRNA/tRNA 2'-O-methyltransferase [Thermoprotei archaeon]|nr:MAG: fibrillarin-like rRNA/tRNA 2'-O-methyltransferase [Thermoprotei archaeon]RLF23377.1 MAG: fibrillarin-like rRNA/tRNA 2'-O-methyltransferase [Thermoprotei archaeon]